MNIVLGKRFASAVLALFVLCTGMAGAQTWSWHVLLRVPDRPALDAQSRVVLSDRDVALTYSAHVDGRDVPITSCRAGLSDIVAVRAMNLTSGAYLFISMKPQHAASCASGQQPIALVPIGGDSNAGAAVSAIAQACCSRVVSVAAPRPRAVAVANNPRPVQAPVQAPTPVPTQAPPAMVPPSDWIETEGVFAFLRVRNRDSRPLTIAAVNIADCRAVIYGCGRVADRPSTIEPGGVANIATIMSGDPKGPQFSYRYEADIGAGHYAGGGLFTKRLSDPSLAMPPNDVRAAEAAAVNGIGTARSPQIPAAPRTPAPPTFVGPRLVQRGSTRLGIGQRGLAILRVHIGSNGMPQNASIVSINNRALVAAALETAVSSTYTPAQRNGRAAEADYIATFQFSGDDPALAATPVWRRGPSAPPAAAAVASPPVVARPSATPSPAAAPPAAAPPAASQAAAAAPPAAALPATPPPSAPSGGGPSLTVPSAGAPAPAAS